MSSSSRFRPGQRAAALAGLLLLACSSEPTAPVTLELAAHSGDLQVAPAGTTLPNPLAVRVTDSRGRPVPDLAVHWAVEEGGGFISATTTPSLTDAQGIARIHRTLGPGAGSQTTLAKLAQDDASPTRFTSYAQIEGATQMAAHPVEAGLSRTDTVRATLATPYRVVVRDQAGAPVAGVGVRWSLMDNQGSLSAGTSFTALDGVAEVWHTLGPTTGPQRVAATVYGLAGSPVILEAVATHGRPAALAALGGGGAMVVAGTPLAIYTVRATDVHGNVANGVAVDWAVTTGGGSVSSAQVVTAGPGATVTHTLGPGDGAQSVTATASGIPGAPSVTFTTTTVAAIVVLRGGDYWDCYYYGNCGRFEPKSVVIPVGRTVGWSWDLTLPCDVVFEDAPMAPHSSALAKSGRHLRTFTVPGTYRYRCTALSSSFVTGMVGTVTVQ